MKRPVPLFKSTEPSGQTGNEALCHFSQLKKSRESCHKENSRSHKLKCYGQLCFAASSPVVPLESQHKRVIPRTHPSSPTLYTELRTLFHTLFTTHAHTTIYMLYETRTKQQIVNITIYPLHSESKYAQHRWDHPKSTHHSFNQIPRFLCPISIFLSTTYPITGITYGRLTHGGSRFPTAFLALGKPSWTMRYAQVEVAGLADMVAVGFLWSGFVLACCWQERRSCATYKSALSTRGLSEMRGLIATFLSEFHMSSI